MKTTGMVGAQDGSISFALLPDLISAWQGKNKGERAVDKPDLLIVGLDRLGLDLAMAASALGASVVLATGGEAALDHAIRDGEFLARLAALRGEDGRAGFESRRRALIERISRAHSLERLRAARVDVETGPLVWQDPRRVTIGSRSLMPRRIVLATGWEGETAFPQALELFQHGVIPKRVVLRGESPATLTLAACLAEAGAKTSIVSASGFLPGFQPEGVALLLQSLQRRGVSVMRDLPAPRAADLPIWDLPKPEPALARFGMAALGLAVENGRLKFGGHLETSLPRISVLGSLASLNPSTESDPAEVGYLLARLLLRKPGRFVASPALRGAGSRPGLYETGLSEEAARGLNGPIQIARAASGDQAPESEADPSLVTLIADRRGRLLGASVLSPDARQMVSVLALAIQKGMTLDDLSRLPCPAEGDLIRQAASAPARAMLRSPSLQRALRVMRHFG